MSIGPIGDLAKGFALRQQSNVLKNQMTRLTAELTSGKTSDVTRHLAGDFSNLADIKHRLAILDSNAAAATQGRIDSGVMQDALSRVQTEAQKAGEAAMAFTMSPGASLMSSMAGDAKNAIGSILGALNVSVAGRSLFAGDEVGGAAITGPDDFLLAVRNAAAGATDAASFMSAMDDFFNDPAGGFQTSIFQGGTAARAGYPLGDGETVTLDLKANDPVFREVLKNVAMAAILDDQGLALTRTDQKLITRAVGESLLTYQDQISAIRADLGFAEARIDRASSRISAEIAGLGMMRTDLLEVDPYETASRLEEVQARLEAIYTLTARMSRLNLVNFL